MRRAWAIVLFALVLVASSGTALAQKRANPFPDLFEGKAPRELERAAQATGGVPTLVWLAAFGGLALLLLAVAAWLAMRSRRAKVLKPPKRTFEHGRKLGRQVKAMSPEAAMQALARMPVGELARAAPGRDRVEVVIQRRKNQPCVQAAGYLAGLFEGAWAREVRVAHPECAGEKGGPCRYIVEAGDVRRPLSASDAPAGAASTRGSADAPRRSPPARPGGG